MKKLLAFAILMLLISCGGGKKELAIISTHISASPGEFKSAVKDFGDKYSIKIYDPENFSAKKVSGADLVIFESFGSRISLVQPSVDSIMAKTKVYFIDTPGVKGNADEKRLKGISKYWENGNRENFVGMLSYIGKSYFGLNIPVPAPVEFPKSGFYHPSSKTLFKTADDYFRWYSVRSKHPDSITVGLVFYQSSFVKKDMQVVDALVKSIESKGCNAITYLSKGKFKIDSAFVADGRQRTDVLIYGGMFLDFANYKKGIERAKKLDVPILVADVDNQRTVEEWRKSQEGFVSEKSGKLYFTEHDGAFEPMLVGAKEISKSDEEHTVPIPEQVEWRVNRAISWAKLRRKKNSDKKIVITYYSEGSGKANVGSDSDAYLNAQRSIINILKKLKTEGYNLGEKPLPTEQQLSELMAKHASNVGTWAPAEIRNRKENGDYISVPLGLYEKWFASYPAALQKQVLQKWGLPPGKLIVSPDKSELVIPVIKFGNITLAPHPNWGLQDNKSLIYGTDAIPPSHAYIAFYEWMKHSGTDAFVTLFTQLSLMPGKNEGPSSQDFVGRLLGNVPHITFVPLMSGSAVKNKRRANALTIGYMNEVGAAGLPAIFQPVKNLLDEWATASSPQIKESVGQKLLDFAAQNPGKFGSSKKPSEIIENIRSYLQKIALEKIPNATHTIGEAPSGLKKQKILSAMLEEDGKNFAQKHSENPEVFLKNLLENKVNYKYKADSTYIKLLKNRELYSSHLDQAGNELSALASALSAHYIEPGPSDDIVRNPESLPPGRNPYGGNDKAIPSRTAWELGMQMGDRLIENFQKKRGAGIYPKKVAFVLWSTEITNSQGATEAEILYLLGIRPVWNKKGEIISLEKIPREQLGRPRIDVLLTTSGTYRDHFRDKILMLEKAVGLAAVEKDADNSVRNNTEKYSRALNIDFETASARIFSSAPGAYSTNLEFASEDEGSDSKKMSALYLSRMSNSYGKNNRHLPELFAKNIKDVDAAAFSRSSNVLGIMDHPMVAAYYGAIEMAVKSQGGAKPEMFINDLSAGNADVSELESYYHKEMDSRYLNPEWIKNMMSQGYDGAKTISGFAENLLLWNKTSPETVSSKDWDKLYETYVNDQNKLGLEKFFDKNNPYAAQTFAAHLLEASREGYWKATKTQLETLGKAMVSSVEKNGPACSGSVCNAPKKTAYLMGILQNVPGMAEKFENYQAKINYLKHTPQASGANSDVEGYQISERRVAAKNSAYALLYIYLTMVIIFMAGFIKRLITNNT